MTCYNSWLIIGIKNMVIDYVVFSSDDNEKYLDFYLPVAKVWKERIGLKSIFVHITDKIDKDFEQVENDYGFYIKIKAICGCPSSLQSQVVRFFIASMFKDKNLLLSDIDMFPIQREYFIDKALPIREDELYLYSGTPYIDVPYFPACYILCKGSMLTKVLWGGTGPMSFKDYLSMLVAHYDLAWNTDEHYFYDCVRGYPDQKKILLGSRNYAVERRINREELLIKNDVLCFIDCHSVRPYLMHKEKIDLFVDRLLSEK